MLAVLPATSPATCEQALDRALDVVDRLDEEDEQAGDDQRGHEADDQRERPDSVRASLAHRHLAQRARGVQDPHARVVDARDPGELVGLALDDGDTLDGAVRACAAIRRASATIVITIAAATAITTSPSANPTYQPVDAAITSMSHLLLLLAGPRAAAPAR